MPYRITHARRIRVPAFVALATAVAITVLLSLAITSTAGAEQIATGGSTYSPVPVVPPLAPGERAKIAKDGRTAVAPAGAPESVKKAIWAANEIVGKPYLYGGGHKSFKSNGYDCSGTISYALHGGGLLDSPLDSGSFMKWGEAGRGKWITIYTNPGHAYVVIAGLRLDTSGPGPRGPNWRAAKRSSKGFRARHIDGL